MNILQILPELNVGGVETGTVDFAKYLVSSGHKSIVVSNGGTLVEQLEVNGTKHYSLPVHKKSFWTVRTMIKRVREIIKAEQIDIVHARSRVPAWIAFFACRKTNASFITTCHGYYKSRLFSQVMGWSKLVIVPSEVIGRHMIEQYGVSADKIRRIPRSVDLSKFKPRKKEETKSAAATIAIVGRITPLKGHKYFLEAMAKVVRALPYVKIWIIGDAPAKKPIYREQLKEQVVRLGLTNHVEFLGKREDIPDLLNQVDLLIFSSIEPESFGRVILEAQAAGVPVVATHVGGVVDIIDHGKTGILVMPKDTDAMARESIKVLRDPSLAQGLVAEAKKKIKNQFLLEHMASSTVSVYEELQNTMNILVIKYSSLGDVILVSTALREMRQKFPKANIYCLVSPETRKILQNCPYLSGVIVYDYKGKHKGWLRTLRFSWQLRRYNFDIIVDLQNNKRSHFLSFACFPRDSYGYNNGKWSFLLTTPIKNDQPNLAPVPHQFRILSKLNISYPDKAYLELWPTEKDRQYIKSLLDDEWLGSCKKIVGINIAASERWESKNWPIEYIARLCDILSTKNIRVVITGIEKDVPLGNELKQLTKSKPAILIGKTNVLQLAALMKRLKVYVTPDSAPLHVAAAMQIPVIALFGPTDSARHIPPAKKIIILERKVYCSPCYGPKCRIHTHDCMKEITPEHVAEEISKFMD